MPEVRAWLEVAIEAGLVPDVADADTSFVLTTALQDFAHRQRGEADDLTADIATGDSRPRRGPAPPRECR
ncbi:hypothetical protein [Actinomadura sp. NTSP31]|uniref:hypothetical protein n=1 Tax=Actinomadura sp. NTSP31 TaxID=1735447 RepID=UPI0035C0B760